MSLYLVEMELYDVSWFRELHGREPGKVGPGYDALEINVGEVRVVTFIEEHPRVVPTSVGERAVINVLCEQEPYSLWLSRVALASGVALLEDTVPSLEGLSMRIGCPGMSGRMYLYDVEWEGEPPVVTSPSATPLVPAPAVKETSPAERKAALDRVVAGLPQDVLHQLIVTRPVDGWVTVGINGLDMSRWSEVNTAIVKLGGKWIKDSGGARWVVPSS